MAQRALGLIVFGLCVSISGAVAAAQAASEGPPVNLRGGVYQSLIEQMWRASPTFRQQCLTIAREPGLRVTFRTVSASGGIGVRARTEIVRKRGKVVLAEVVLLTLDGVVELIAHEMEHVVEQLEGVRLRGHGCRGSTGRRDWFESCRAHEMGRRVAREVEESRAINVLRRPD